MTLEEIIQEAADRYAGAKAGGSVHPEIDFTIAEAFIQGAYWVFTLTKEIKESV